MTDTHHSIPALQITDLRKTYGEGFEALKGISLDVAPGDFFALLGPNGAGKSTTIGILCSLVKKTSGTVKIFGHDIDRAFSQAKQALGVVPQEFNFNMFENVLDIVVNQAGYYGLPKPLALERAEIYLKKLGLWDKRATQARGLSGGMKRRLLIARALVHEPKLLILDEPTAGVDIELRRSMWEFLREINEAGTTIILTTHYLEEAETLCRNVAIINHGELIENTSIKSLLKQLNTETFVLDVREKILSVPQITGYTFTQVDESSLEVTLESGTPINPMFASLQQAGVDVVSMRNKSNRLEELFVELVGQQQSSEVAE
ncbi:ABC transporter ATP-binding protein [Teredinibacter turnerae]|uniref:ABC transporter domain containing protein n=1 Tax=Teredinibacter turnerae (strain ATCC 39867 / T7901) TaxID=377629 RepID=C5BR57_TERTT|nr:ABC transporter ATP-binding protein [Teredinibacter turnerae]ACR12118.1 ABC transporter domain containing protein [Teredinibacter turnerae T7901]